MNRKKCVRFTRVRERDELVSACLCVCFLCSFQCFSSILFFVNVVVDALSHSPSVSKCIQFCRLKMCKGDCRMGVRENMFIICFNSIYKMYFCYYFHWISWTNARDSRESINKMAMVNHVLHLTGNDEFAVEHLLLSPLSHPINLRQRLAACQKHIRFL